MCMGNGQRSLAQPSMTTLLYFTHDLRVHDNEALITAANSSNSLLCVYCLDRDKPYAHRYGLSSIGDHREKFLLETLHHLRQQLETLGQQLMIVSGKTEKILPALCQQFAIKHCVMSRQFAYDEVMTTHALQETLAHIKFSVVDTFTLFKQEQLNNLPPLPYSFSKFKQYVNDLTISPAKCYTSALPPPPVNDTPINTIDINSIKHMEKASTFTGGEHYALKHLQHYFHSSAASTYKETRNHLDGWSDSCKFSPWLANGALSVREIVQQLSTYESKAGRNDSTAWIFFELLWREYFQWYALHYGKKLFIFSGIRKDQQTPLTSFYPQRFKSWCLGKTPWPLVNACMKELNHTGYISNRARQIVASCLINELQLDWRCGAAYFEQQLIDYDVAINWGNWQYIAGVGVDPRGGRQFNLEKQTALFDPQHQYIQQWMGDKSQSVYAIDHTGIDDWPL